MKKEDIDVFFAGKYLVREYDSHADQFDGEYPPVKNPDALMRGIRSLMREWADMSDGNPNHITMGIYEVQDVNVNGQRRKARKQSDYVISVDDLEDEYGDPGYAIKEVRFSDDRIESLSVIEPQAVHWSPDTLGNTDDEQRTKYYIGLIYRICDHATGYDQDLAPELEIAPDVLMEYLAGGDLPADLQQKAYELKMAEAEQQGVGGLGYEEEATVQERPAYNSIFAYEPEDSPAQTHEEVEQAQAQTQRTVLPWDEPEEVEQEQVEQEQTPEQDAGSYFIDDTNASFEELDLDEEELESMFS